MDQQNSKQSLKQKWENFCNILFDPWVLILVSITVFMTFYLDSVNQSSNVATGNNINKINTSVVTILSTIIAIITGLLGGVIANKWAQITETKVIVARGKSAIRSLKLILLNVRGMEKRITTYISSTDEVNKEHKLIVSNYEELIDKCNVIEEEIISSIENWTDIIPEIESFKTQIGLVTDMKHREIELESDISNLREELKNVKEDEGKEKSKLKEQLQSKELELSKTKSALSKKEAELSRGVLGGLTGTSGWTSREPDFSRIMGISTTPKICNKCAAIFFDNNTSNETCENCRTKKYFSVNPKVYLKPKPNVGNSEKSADENKSSNEQGKE